MRKYARYFLGLIAMLTLLVVVPTLASYFDTHYTREAEVIEVFGDAVAAIDKQGNVWEFEADNLKVGQMVTLKMYTNGTDHKITDDEVIGIK